MSNGHVCQKCSCTTSGIQKIKLVLRNRCHPNIIKNVVSLLLVLLNGQILKRKDNVKHMFFSQYQAEMISKNTCIGNEGRMVPIIRDNLNGYENLQRDRNFDLCFISGHERYKAADVIPNILNQNFMKYFTAVSIGVELKTDSSICRNFTEYSSVDNKKIIGTLSGSRFFVHLSRSPETFGRTIFEAIEAGCIVIARNLGPKVELFPDLIYYQDDDDLISVLQNCLFASEMELAEIRHAQKLNLIQVMKTNENFFKLHN